MKSDMETRACQANADEGEVVIWQGVIELFRRTRAVERSLEDVSGLVDGLTQFSL